MHGWRGEHWLHYDETGLRSYAQVTGDEVATVEMVGGSFDQSLLVRLLEHHDVLDWWTRGPLDAAQTGGEIVRTLQLMRVQLPVAVTPPPANSRLTTFDAQHDTENWLAQNNSAFADHPEQGAWTIHDVKERVEEPWFDPSGFLLLEIDHQLAASCWTKVHELHPDRFGEIYVVSVDPRFQGRGLGRVMVTQGLDALRRKGVSQAVLFVDESNSSARRLYESLGFELQREDRLLRFVK